MSDERDTHKRNKGGRYAANHRKKKKSNKGLLIACIILFVILALAILASAYIDTLLGRINRPGSSTSDTTRSEEEYNQQTDPPITADPSDPDSTTVPEIDPTEITWSQQEPIGGEHVVNILLIGQDRREGQTAQRSDAMILCTLNKDTKKLTMTSFLRDLYVQIPGRQDNRINASYFYGGMKLLDETLELNFGVKVDGNLEVDFYGFMQLIDMLGGVDIELTQAEAEYLNRRGNWGVEESAGQWTLTEGMNHLTGSQTLAYSRIREIGSDFGRTERQRKVLAILLEKAKSLSLLEIHDLLYTALGMVTTDMTDAQITSLVLTVVPMLQDLEIVTQRIPASGAYQDARIRGMMVLVPDMEKNRKLLEDAMVVD